MTPATNMVTDGAYRSLDFERNEIRVVTIEMGRPDEMIRCTLEHVSLDQLPRYQALSYVWGDPGNTVPISLNGVVFQVTTNLYRALTRLRLKGLGAIWIDAICINQRDVSERNQQVALMGSIYRRAAGVIIWLGEKSRSSNSAFEVIDQLQSAESPREVAEKVSLKPVYSLLRRRYWQRMWIIQEIALAQDIIVSCGDQERGWPAFSAAVQCALQGLSPADSELAGFEPFSNLYQLRRIITEGAAPRKVSLLEALRRSVIAHASDPRDKVFGLLGLVNDGDTYVPRPNYAAPLENLCLGMALGYISGKRTLDAIVLLGRGIDDDSVARNASPSWLPHWHNLSVGYERQLAYLTGNIHPKHKSPLFAYEVKAAGLSECQAHYRDGILSCRGIYVGTIQTVGYSIWDESRNIASNVRGSNGLRNPYLDNNSTFKAIYTAFLGVASSRVYLTLMARSNDVHFRSSDEAYLTEFMRLWRSSYQPGYSPDIQAWINNHKGFRVHGKTIEQWAHWKSWTKQGINCRRKAAAQRKNTMLADVQRFVAPDLAFMIRNGLRLMLTDRGHIGWAHFRGRPGDLLYVLQGCSVPVILRPASHDTFRLVGDAWIQGFMNGEAIKEDTNNSSWARVDLV
ncbi:heterokaryon incompatibility protein-domain-containing protein [Xylaria grammica]|nr:heterokaryon incompatibility protein-domain-containing protein [Xylaria grammica]